MKPSTPLSQMMNHHFTSIEINSSWDKIYKQFQKNPTASYLPIVKEGKFKGVIYRSEFIKNYLEMEQRDRLEDLICKNIITLSPDNAYEDAKEIYEYGTFPLIPIVDDWNNLVGVLSQENFANKTNVPYSPFTSLFQYQKAS